jgi:hypothetical protein
MPPFLHAAKAAASGGPKSVFKSATAPYFVTSQTLTAVFCATVVRGPIFPEASWADTIDGRESAKSTADLSNIFDSYGEILDVVTRRVLSHREAWQYMPFLSIVKSGSILHG